MNYRKQIELIGQYPDTPGGHRSPGRAVLSSCSDEVKIKGNRGHVVVDRFAHVIHLRCFGELVAGIGVTALAGDVIHMTVLSHQGGGFLRALCVAVTGVAVGGASGPSNESALAHLRLLREDRDLCVSHDSAELLLAKMCRVFRILLWHCLDTEMATGGDGPTGLVSTLTWSYRSPGTLRRPMLIWIRMESMSFRQFRTSWVCIPGGRKRLLSGVAWTG